MKPSILIFSLLFAAGSVLAQAPVQPQNHAATQQPERSQSSTAGQRVPTVTRTVRMFTQIENDWIDAVQRRDRGALKDIVAVNFELRSAEAPGTPTPREESITHAFQVKPFQSSIGQMAVHEYGEVLVVSFLWKLEVPKNGPLPQKLFVIDTFKQIDGNWQAVARYTAPVADPAKTVPGSVTAAPAIKKAI